MMVFHSGKKALRFCFAGGGGGGGPWNWTGVTRVETGGAAGFLMKQGSSGVCYGKKFSLSAKVTVKARFGQDRPIMLRFFKTIFSLRHMKGG